MILLNDILKINEKDLSNIKIRFNMKNKNKNGEVWNPIEFFKEKNYSKLLEGQFHNYNENKVFKEGQIAIGFIKIDRNEPFYLLFDISKITKDLNRLNGIGYEWKMLKEFEKYFGRIIIKFENKYKT